LQASEAAAVLRRKVVAVQEEVVRNFAARNQPEEIIPAARSAGRFAGISFRSSFTFALRWLSSHNPSKSSPIGLSTLFTLRISRR
jgi:hypothetical protein